MERMKFVCFSFKADTQTRAEAFTRFKKTGGLPPKGAKLLGRRTRADFSGRFGLLETEDTKALTEFALMWSDLMELTIVPVVEDPELGEVLEGIST